MYAVIEIAGQQIKVEEGKYIFSHRLKTRENEKVTFSKVLLICNDKEVNIGAPVIRGASVKATMLEHLKADKVIAFKKKRRKGYKKTRGHRQYLSKIQINSIVLGEK